MSSFDIWGISEADINGIDDDRLEEIHSEIYRKFASEIDQFYRKTDSSDPIAAELSMIRKRFKLKALMCTKQL